MSIHAGTYQIAGTTLNQIAAAIDPPANATVRAYPGDVVILDGGPAPTGVLVGTTGRDNVTIDGLVIKGLASFRDTTGSEIVNCDLSVGGDNSPGWDFGSLAGDNPVRRRVPTLPRCAPPTAAARPIT